MNLAPHPITLRQLQYVVAIADRGSFRGAAEDCHVAQPSLSAQVAALEEGLGVQIFERSRRRVQLTGPGRQVVDRARALLLLAEELVESTRALTDPLAQTLRVGAIPTIAPYLLPEVAPRLRAEYPRATFLWREEKTEKLVEALARAELDAAMVALESDLRDLPYQVIGNDPFVLAVAPEHPLGRTKRLVRWEELNGEHVLLLDDGHCFRDQAISFCSRQGVVEASFRATSLATLVQMAASGVGVTLLPKLALEVENRRGDLRVRRFAEDVPGRTLVLVWRKGLAVETLVRRVGETLRNEYRAIARRKP